MKKYLLIFCFIFLYTALYAENLAPVITNPGAEYSKPTDASAPFSQAKFVPDISFIADFSAVARDMGNETYEALEVPGLIHAHSENGHEHEHAALNAKNGFNFNYGELSLYSVVDPYFDLFATFHLSAESFEVEEAYFRTLSLPLGFRIKAGKFLSSFGRLNEQHTHFWDFANAPLVHRAFFGDHGLLETGAQLTWLAPAPFYLLFGTEILTGENEASFGAAGFVDFSGTNKIHESNRPNVYTGYIKTSFDTEKLVMLLGASTAFGKTRTDHGVDEDPLDNPEGHAVYGTTAIFGADITLKYLIDSYRYLSLQGEYICRRTDGHRYDNSGSSLDFERKQSGLYSQLVLRFAQRWRTGLRYDLIRMNSIELDGSPQDLPENMPRYSAMLEYNTSEFARIRLQYSRDFSAYLDEGSRRKLNNEIIVQCNMAIGAHGAHAL